MARVNPKLVPNYRAGIDAGYAKMVARVGRAEADRWRQGALNSAQYYAQRYEQRYAEWRRSAGLEG